LILGIAGQNGRLLTEFLLQKNYRVVGFGLKDSIENSASLRGGVCAKLGVRNSPLTNEQGEPMVCDGKLALGNFDATRDWGYAGDYVQAMWQMLQQPQADDFVIGTGVRRSVRDMCEAAYAAVGLDWRDHVAADPRFVRPAESRAAVADASKARRVLGWQPTTGFEDMLADMVAAHMERFKQG